MTGTELLKTMEALGVELLAEGGHLRVRARKGVLTPEHEALLRTHKEELLELLERHRPSLQPVAGNGTRPLSFSQRTLWIMDRLAPRNPFNNVAYKMDLDGDLEVAVLNAALADLAERHEILRTTYGSDDSGEPVQRVETAPRRLLAQVDFTALPESRQEAALADFELREARRPFDPGQVPPIRYLLLRRCPSRHRLLLCTHHLVVDGVSMVLFTRDLVAFYRARLAGLVEAALPPLRIQFGDYAVWQRKQVEGGGLDEQQAYWLEQLADLPPLLELPWDFPRPERLSYRGARHAFEIPEELTAGLKRLGTRCRSTLFMTLLAGFEALLYRLTGSTDLAIGSPVANRQHTETEELIGFFANNLVLRGDLSGNPSFETLLARVRHVTLEAYRRSDWPFEKLVESLRPQRSAGHNPLFQAMFAVQRAPSEELELPGLTWRFAGVENGTTHFDLSLYTWESAGKVGGIFRYSLDVFAPETMALWADVFLRLLSAVVEEPCRRLDELPLTPSAGSPEAAPRPAEARRGGLPAVFAAHARQRPAAAALRVGDDVVTYGRLDELSRRAAGSLHRLGVVPGDTVAIAPGSPAVEAVAVLAAWKAGAAFLALDPADSPAWRLALVRRAAAAAVIVAAGEDSDFLGDVPNVVLGADLRVLGGNASGEAPADRPAEPGDVAYRIPQGRGLAAVRHATLASRLDTLQQSIGLEASDRVLARAPLSHDAAIRERLWPWLVGAGVVFTERTRDDPGRWKDLDVTVVGAEEPELAAWLAHRGGTWRPRLWLTCGPPASAPAIAGLPAADRRRLRHCLSSPSLGRELTLRSGEELPVGAYADLGRPLEKLLLLDDRRHEALPGAFGEIWVLTDEGLRATGERARRRHDGRLEWTPNPRLGWRGGRRVDLVEARDALLRLPGVAAAHVSLRPSPAGPALVAYVVADRHAAQDWERELRSSRPAAEVPEAFVTVSHLPLTRAGDVDVAALHALPVGEGTTVAEWERELEARFEAPVAVTHREADFDERRLHLDDILPGLGVRRGRPRRDPPPEPGGGTPEPTATVPALSDGGPLVLPPDAPRTLSDALLETAARYPDQGLHVVAERGRVSRLTYKTLVRTARRILGGLRDHGLGPGDPVLLQIADLEDHYPAFWACVLGGMTPVTVAVAPTYRSRNGVVDKLFNTWKLLEEPAILTSSALLPEIRGLGEVVDMPELRLLDVGVLKESAPAESIHPARPEDVAFLQLSSGSTGIPKCIRIRHGGIVDHVHAARRCNGYESSDVSLNWLPLDHVVPILTCHVKDVYLGCRQVVVPTRLVLADPLLWLDLMDEYRVTHSWSPNFGFKLISDAVAAAPDRRWDLGALRYLMNAGEQVTEGVVSAFCEAVAPFGAGFGVMQPAFGMAEVCTCMTYANDFHPRHGVHRVKQVQADGVVRDADPDEAYPVCFVDLGPPVEGVAIRIADANQQTVAENVIGRLQIRGSVVTPGYRNNDKANREAFVGDGWFDSGDLGFLRNGRLSITGRAKEMIIVYGANYYCYELEDAVNRLPGVLPTYSGACALEDPASGSEGLALFFVPQTAEWPEQVATVQRIQAEIARGFGIEPLYVVPMEKEAFPKTTSGKIQRTRLRGLLEAGAFDATLKELDLALARPNTLPDVFFRRVWLDRRPTSVPRPPGGPYAVLAPDGGGGEEVARRLRAWGERCVLIRAGDSFAEIGGDEIRLPAADRSAYDRLAQVLTARGAAPRQLLHLWASSPPETSGDEVLFAAGLLGSLQALRTPGLEGVWVVTAAGLATAADEPWLPGRSTAAGWTRALAEERPELEVRLLDLDPAEPAEHPDQILAELRCHDREPEVAWRAGRRRVPRLRRALPADAAAATPAEELRQGGLYVLTGGLGGLGTAVAEVLLRGFQAHLLLLGRSPSPEDDAPGTGRLAERRRALRKLASLEGEVRYRCVDVTDAAALREAVESAEADWNRPLAGIFHLAGVYREQALGEESVTAAAEVLRPKLSGMTAIESLLESRPEALCVVFSSVFGTFGAVSLGAYAAANRVLDHWATRRRRRGEGRDFSLGWSQWKDLGMSAGFELHEALRRRGYRVLDPERATLFLRAALRADPGHVLIGLDGAHPRIRRQLTGAVRNERQPVVVVESAGDGSRPGAVTLRDRFGTAVRCETVVVETLPRDDEGRLQRDALRSFVGSVTEAGQGRKAPETAVERLLTELWKEVLGTEPSVSDDFFHLGGHSLKATQTVARVADLFRLPVELQDLFSARTVEGLAARLAEKDPVPGRAEALAELRLTLRGLDEEALHLRLAEAGVDSAEAWIDRTLAARGFTLSPSQAIPTAERSGPQPLALAQERLWFLYQLEPDSPMYNVETAVMVRGPLDVEPLLQGLRTVLRRHAPLRTTFADLDGRAVQRVRPLPELDWRLHDLTRLGARQQRAEVGRRIAAACLRPFDLTRGPLLRVEILRLAAQRHAVAVVLHHVVADRWSLNVLLAELLEAYGAAREGRSAELPGLAVEYLDYVHWQREALSAPVRERLSAFWLDHLQGAAPVLALPLDRPRPAVRSFRGGSRPLRLPPRLTQALEARGKAYGGTLFMTLLAGFALLLHRFGGSRDLVIGTPIANRTRPELEALIGLFVNTLAVRLQVDPGCAVSRLLAEAREVMVGAYDHQDMPFELLVDTLQPERDLSTSPVFQVLLVLQNVPAQILELGSLEVTPLAVDSATAKFDLTLELEPREKGLSGKLEYNPDLFDATTIERLIRAFGRLLDALAADAEIPQGALPLMSRAELHQQLTEWNPPASSDPAAVGMTELFAAQARQRGERTALLCDERSWTYRTLDVHSDRLAGMLVARGVRGETPVAIFTPRSFELIAGLLAILKAGAFYVPIDPDLPPRRIAYLLRDSGARWVLGGESMRRVPLPEGAELLVWPELEDDIPETEDRKAAPRRDPSPPESLAYLTYTSGSTGRPKGVAIPRRGVLRLVHSDVVELGAEETWLLLSPLAFDASTFEIWGSLLHGARLVVAPPAPVSLERIGELIRRHAVTTLWLTAGLFQAMVRERPADLLGVRTLVAGGDALGMEAVRTALAVLPETRLVNGYGPTENTTFSTSFVVPAGKPVGRSVPIGRPIRHDGAYVLDDRLFAVPVGVAGELGVSGDGLARGYAGRPAQTACQLVPHPFARRPGARLYRTGDQVRYRGDGQVEFLGRRDFQVKIRGFRVELGEVEAALNNHPRVAEAAAVVEVDGAGTKRLVGYVVEAGSGAPEGSGQDLTQVLRDHLATDLPDPMVPARLVRLPAMPRTPHGKIARQALAGLAPDPVTARPSRKPESRLERRLAAVWRDVLGTEEVGVEDDFFALGGDSILALQLASRLRREGFELRLKELYQHRTVRALSRVVGQQTVEVADQPAVLGEVPLTPVQRDFLAQRQAEPWHFVQSLVLSLRPDVHPGALRDALQALWVHHDQLRARFPAGGAAQTVGPPDGESPGCTVVDLGGCGTDEARTAAMARAAARVRARLDLEHGPLTAAVLFTFGGHRAPRLLWVAHHLVVDGVSWRVLLEDLDQAYRQTSAGKPVRLPAKTASFQTWSRSLGAALERGTEEERAFWRRLRADDGARVLPCDRGLAPENDLAGDSGRLVVRLTAADTTALLRRPQDLGGGPEARLEAVLLAALARSWLAWTGASSLVLDREGHGRVSGRTELDVSRTVGWFTAVSPLRLVGIRDLPFAEAVGSVSRELAAVPENGAHYGWSEAPVGAPLVFNFLGQLDPALGSSLVQELDPDSFAATRSPRHRRTHPVEVDVWVLRGELGWSWTYARGRHDEATIRRLAEGCLRQLSEWARREREASALDRARGMVPASFDLEDAYPLTPLQHGLLFHDLLSPGSGLYVEQLICTLEGEVDLEAFRGAWDGMARLFTPLRTSFHGELHATPLQAVHRTVDLPWRHDDWSDLDPRTQQERFDEALAADRALGFDLGRPPLVRLWLIRTAPAAHRFVFSFHHLLLDGWSLPLLFQRLFSSYTTWRRGGASEVPAAREPEFRRYVEWLAARSPDRSRELWREVLAGFQAPTPLLLDRGRSAAVPATPSVVEAEVRLEEELTRRLGELARRHHLTTSLLVQGAWALVLRHHAQENDVLFGLTVSGRPAELPEATEIVGMLINTLPVRVRWSDERPVIDTLIGMRDQQAARQPYEHCSLAEIQTWSEVPAGMPLFESLLAFENYPVPDTFDLDEDELRVHGVQVSERTHYPLTAVAVPREQLLLRVAAASHRFPAEVAEILVHRWRQALQAILDRPAARPGELDLLSAAQRRDLAGVGTVTDLTGEATLPQQIAGWVRRQPAAVAVTCGPERLTRAELDRRAAVLAAHLRESGVGRETRVALCLPRSVEWIVAMLATWKAGGAFVLLDPAHPAERLRFMVEDSGAARVLAQEDSLPKLDGVSVPVDRLGRDAEERDGVSRGFDLRPDPGDAASLAYVIYTSGSTGRPKGVAVAHLGALNLAAWHRRAFAIGEDDRVAQVAAPAFDAAVWEVFPSLAAGASLHLPPAERLLSAEGLRDWMIAEEITASYLPTPVAERMLELPWPAATALRWLLTGGDRLRSFPPPELPFRLVNNYGPTEGSVVTTSGVVPARPEIPEGPPTLGTPVDNTRVWVTDSGLRALTTGVPGELCIAGDGLARGYLGRPALTAKSFVPDPYGDRPGDRLYRTGDRVRRLADGSFDFLGRFDDQVKVRGFRIELGEVESVLAGHPGISEVAVVLRSRSGGDGQLTAFLVAAEGPAPEVGELRTFLGNRLPAYMVPASWIWLDRLPTSPNGKVDRRALREQPVDGDERGVPYQAPESRLEREIAEAWSRTLGVERIGLDDNFFELGGHSLLVGSLLAELHRGGGDGVDPVDLFKYPTVRALARHLSRGEPEPADGERIAARADRQKQALARWQRQRGRNRS